MATDKKISELPIATAIDPADISVLVDNGTDYQFAFSTLLSFIGSSLNLGANISFGGTLPQNTSGKNGDVFINTSAGSFAQKISGDWTVVYTLPSTTGSTDGTVLYGLGVPGNATGNNNDTCINTGTGVFYKKSAGAWSQVFSMQTGPAGPAGSAGINGVSGTNGKTILNGTTNPSNISTGTDGDFYINTATFMFFGPKTGGVWPAGTSLAGSDGPTGPAGPKGDKGDTGTTGPAGPGVPAGGTAGQVLAKVDGTDGNTQWIAASSGSSPGGISTNIQYNNSGALDGDNNFRYDNSTGSLYVGNPLAYVVPSGNIYFFGDSITSGTGASSGKSYSNLVSATLGLNENNFGVSGSTLEKQLPIDPFGSSNMVDKVSSIPIKGNNDKWLVFMFGINDWQYAGTNYNPINFINDYNIVINNALSKGWSASNIIITSTTYCNPALYGTTGLGGGSQTLLSQQAFNAATQSVANSFGTLYVELFKYLENKGGAINLLNNLHPNNAGHALYAQAILNVIRKQVYASGQSLLINGSSEFYKIIYNTNNVFDNGLGTPLGIDNNGVVGRLNDLPYQFQLNYPILESGLLQAGASLPITYNKNDILIKQDTLLTSALDNQDGALWNSIKLADGLGSMNFYTHFVNGLFKFYTVNGATPAFVIDRDGSIGTATVATSVGNPGHTAGDVDVPNGAGLLSNIAGSYGAFQPQDISGHTYIRNSWTSGQIRIFTSSGILANQSESIVIWPKGEVTMQNGDTHNYNPIARLALNSTSQGFLLPRMSTENRNAMGFVVGFNFSSGGSEYTSPPSVSFSGGGGSGAAATVTMLGSGVSGIIITNPGTGYTNAPMVSFSGGGGSGAAATAILSLDTNIGLQILNTDTNCVEYWNGSTWVCLAGIVIDTTTTPYTKSTINTAYPNAPIGFKVVADSAGFTYIKKTTNSSGNWSVIASSQLT